MKKNVERLLSLFLSSLFILNITSQSAKAFLISSSSNCVRVNNACVWGDYDEDTGDLYVIMAYDNNNDVVVSKANLINKNSGVYDGAFKNVPMQRASKYSSEYWEYLKSYAKENVSEFKLNEQTLSNAIENRGSALADSVIATRILQAYGQEYNLLLKTDTTSYQETTIKIWEMFNKPLTGYSMLQVYAGWYLTTAISNIAQSMGLDTIQALTEAVTEVCADIINTAYNTFSINAKIYPYMCSPTTTRYGLVNDLKITFSEASYDLDVIALYCEEEEKSVLKVHSQGYMPSQYAYSSPNYIWLIREAYIAYNNYI